MAKILQCPFEEGLELESAMEDIATILVVDDNPSNLQVLMGLLGEAGYKVRPALSGEIALRTMEISLPDLILLDVQMPTMDGYAVCARLKEDESTRHIPVIFVTARDDVEAESRCFALGAADYITKPFKLPVVLARVKTHLALYRQRLSLEGMFRDVVEAAPDAFILADTQGNMVQMNARAQQLFGYSRAEMMGRPVAGLVALPLRGDDSARGASATPAREVMTGMDVPCRRKNGTEFPGDVNLTPLETHHGRLLMAVVRDMSERQKAAQALHESRQRLRELAAQTEATREEERKHIAREVHDELGQILTALRMELSFLGLRDGASNPALADKLLELKGLVDRAIQGVRNVATNLRPTALDMGLVPAIEWLCREFTQRTAVPCVLGVQHQGIELDEARAIVVFRIVQESLTNIGRYANASRVDVTLDRCDDELRVLVRDNGRGFDPATASQRKSFGLLGMRERAIALGGQLDVSSVPGAGTVIRVSAPIQDTALQTP
jgi:PAS domain S-box-containing protein